MKIIFYILNILVSFLGLLGIFYGNEEDLFLGFLILVVSALSVIFVTQISDANRIKFLSHIIGLNIMGVILFSGLIYRVNNFFNGEIIGIFFYIILPAFYLGVNLLYIKSFRKKLKISVTEKKEIVILSEESEDLGNNTEPKKEQDLTPACELYIDEQALNMGEEKEHIPVPRKVNWESVQKARKQTGDFGEAIVVEYEKSILIKQGQLSLSEKVALVSSKNLGYDVFSKSESGNDKYIEVKSFAKSQTVNFIVTRNELNFLQENTNSSFVYLITDCDTEPKIMKMAAKQFFKLNLKPSVFKITL
jgi:hypothetical protein